MADSYADGTCQWWTAGVRDDVDEGVIDRTFGGWRVEHRERAVVPSDTRMLEVIVGRLSV
jgi:hypothetical protein